MVINLKTTGQYEILKEVLAKAILIDYDIEHSRVGYNENSGYIWMWSEMESYSIGITDYAYNRGEEVQIIITCPETGEEFIAYTWDEANDQYKQWCEEEGIEVEL